jgi:hypothetical protein
LGSQGLSSQQKAPTDLTLKALANASFKLIDEGAYIKSFELYQGGKRTNPWEHRKLCDWGENEKPMQRQFEG